MSKTKRFEIESGEPSGTTFAGNRTHIKDMADRTSQHKPSTNFGIESGPIGTTFEVNKSHIKFPDADKAPSEKDKFESGNGKYSPTSKGPENFGGSVGVGTSAKKSGRSMKPMRSFS